MNKLHILAQRVSMTEPNPIELFKQAFNMGRQYQSELNTNLYNNMLQEKHKIENMEYGTKPHYWEQTISSLEEEIEMLRSKYEPQEYYE